MEAVELDFFTLFWIFSVMSAWSFACTIPSIDSFLYLKCGYQRAPLSLPTLHLPSPHAHTILAVERLHLNAGGRHGAGRLLIQSV